MNNNMYHDRSNFWLVYSTNDKNLDQISHPHLVWLNNSDFVCNLILTRWEYHERVDQEDLTNRLV